MTPPSSFRLATPKILQILKAGREQLSPEEFEELTDLLFDLETYGLTPWINTQLGKLMARIDWELDVGESPEWHEALQQCDYAFLGNELKAMAYEVGASPVGHKKQLCARLYKRKHPAVLAVMEPYLKEMTPEQIKAEITRHALTMLPQTEPIWATDVAKIKNRLEDLHRTNPDEFYRRKDIIRQSIREREKGQQKTMPDFTLQELLELLKFTERLYR